MDLLILLYDFWGLICIAGVLLTVIPPLLNLLSDSSPDKKKIHIGSKGRFFVIVGIVFILLSVAVNVIFVKVPDVTRLTRSEARAQLRNVGLNDGLFPDTSETEEDATQTVIWQAPEKGILVLKGTKVLISYPTLKNTSKTVILDDTNNVSYDASTNEYNYEQIKESNAKVVVPNVVNMEQSNGVKTLNMCGLQYQVYWSNNRTDSNTYYIVSQSYQAGSLVDAGTVVKLELSPNMPESGAIDFSYEVNDDEVKTSDELKGFYLKTVSTTNGSFYNAETNSTTVLDYIPVKLCHVIFNVTGAEDSILSISMIDKNTGLCIDNDNGKSELYINKGEYTIMADFGDYSKTVNINITGSSEYDISFK